MSSTGVFEVGGGRALAGETGVPGDKSISHRALLLAALAEGTSTLTGLSTGDDVVRTHGAVAALGAGVTPMGPDVVVHGGRGRLAAPAGEVDLGNSGTGMRLLMGVAATLPGTTAMTGDASLCRRPMDRVAVPLEQMGAAVAGAGERCLPPLTVTGGALRGITYEPPMASAQVKGCHYFVEVRSLNNKYFKANIRLAEEFQGLEAEFESRLRERVSRGTVTVTARCSEDSASAAHEINLGALASCRRLQTKNNSQQRISWLPYR